MRDAIRIDALAILPKNIAWAASSHACARCRAPALGIHADRVPLREISNFTTLAPLPCARVPTAAATATAREFIADCVRTAKVTGSGPTARRTAGQSQEQALVNRSRDCLVDILTGVGWTPALGVLADWIPLSEISNLAALAPLSCARIPTA